MRNLRVTIRDGEELVFKPELPPGLSQYQVFPTILAATGHWGVIIFQIVIAENFAVWYSNFLIKEDAVFTIEADQGGIELYVVTKGAFDFEVNGVDRMERIYVREGQFNITNFPHMKMRVHFKAGEYLTFNVSLSEKCLQRFTPYLPALETLVRHVKEKKLSHLTPQMAYSSPKIKEIVNDILKHDYTEGLGNIYLEPAILLLLTFAIKKIRKENRKRIRLNAEDAANAENIKQWIDSNNNDAVSLSPGELAAHFNIDDHRLRKAFKVLYGTTVFDYLLELRLGAAKKLMEETDKTISEIAYLAGYTSHSHLTHAFKKRFGYPPSDLRKNKD